MGTEECWCRGVGCAHYPGCLYLNARCSVRVNCQLSEEFGVHQGSVLSPLLFIIVLEVPSHEFNIGVPWELLYADDLVIIADSLEGCVARLKTWKSGMESKGFRVNMIKTKFLVSDIGLDVIKDSDKYPCTCCLPLWLWSKLNLMLPV